MPVMSRKIRMGMVGGGQDAFIGAVHRHAAFLDGKIELVAGAFSSNAEKSRLSGQTLGLSPDRVYATFAEMAEAEAKLGADERIDFVSIVTPNYVHFPAAEAFLKAGFHVVCDKPITHRLEDAEALAEIVGKSDRIFALTHNYTGYPMVKQAREMVTNGELGTIRKIVAEYPQGWLALPIDAEGQKQAAWRTDPSRAGASSCLGDIGVHAENLARYITGLEIEAVCADFTTFVPGRQLEDDASVLLKYQGGAKGVLSASQISIGEENDLNIRVYGTKAGLEWHQENPNDLIFKPIDQPRQILRRGNPYLGEAAKRFTRLPPGHPEAFIEAFANIYLEVARAIADRVEGSEPGIPYDFPSVEDGVDGMRFIERCVISSKSSEKWTPFH